MERVLAWPGPDGPGYCNLHWTSPKGPGVRGRPFKEVHDLISTAQYAATRPATYKDIYFCLSTQAVTGKVIHGQPIAARSKHTATKLKAVWFDIDVKDSPKGYPTKEEAQAALDLFVQGAKIPPPSAIVDSGGGLHVYWISKTPLSQAEWRPYAEGMAAEAVRLGLKCDPITTDAARILRVPGTFNNKQVPPRPVTIIHMGEDYDFEEVLEHIQALGTPTEPATVTVTGGPRRTLLPFDMAAFEGKVMAPGFARALDPKFDSLAEGIGINQDLPLNPDEVVKGCDHFRTTAVDNGAAQGQGLWMLTMLATTWFEDGRTWAHYLSKGYAAYSRQETDQMYDRKLQERTEHGLGWPSCTAFENEGAKCKSCPFYGKLRSPLNLAERVQPCHVVAAPAPPPPVDLPLPPGYTVDPTTGWICEIIQKNLANGVSVEELRPLFMCQIKDPILQAGRRLIKFKVSLDGGRWGTAVVTELDMASEQAIVKALRRDGVKPFPDNQKRIIQFMTSFMAEVDRIKKRIETVPFGWLHRKGDGEESAEMPVGFAYGGRVVMNDGTTQEAGFADNQLEKYYRPTGRQDPWMKALHMVTEQKIPEIEAIIAASFAAPLMRATGQYNGILCAWSNGSGAHKSTSVAIGAAVWGSPPLTKESPLSSNKGIVRKFGAIKNLPVYWDEVNSPQQLDQVRVIVESLSSGSEGTKLHQDRSIWDRDSWRSLMVVCSNKSLTDNITANVKDTDAPLQRVLEFAVPIKDDTKKDLAVSRLIESLDHNYGHMGLLYSQLLGRDPAAIDTTVTKIVEAFCEQVGHTSQERFRSSVAATIFAGAALANEVGCNFNLDLLWPFLKQAYLQNRMMTTTSFTVGGTALNIMNTLSQFFKSAVQNYLVVGTVPMRRKGHPMAIRYIAGPTPQRPAKVDVRGAVDSRIIDISLNSLRRWCIVNGYDFPGLFKGLQVHYAAASEPRIDLTAGTGLLGLRETVIRIPVPPGSPFEQTLFSACPMDERPVTVTETEDEEGGTKTAAEQAAADLALVRKVS